MPSELERSDSKYITRAMQSRSERLAMRPPGGAMPQALRLAAAAIAARDRTARRFRQSMTARPVSAAQCRPRRLLRSLQFEAKCAQRRSKVWLTAEGAELKKARC